MPYRPSRWPLVPGLLLATAFGHLACNADGRNDMANADGGTTITTPEAGVDTPDPGNGLTGVTIGPGNLPVSRLIGGAELDPNLYWPPTGQICEVKLDDGGNVLPQPPQAFIDSCAACHGNNGSGKNGNPGVRKTRTYDEFSALVRAGYTGTVGGMPAFPEDWLNEPDLKRIWAYAFAKPIFETGDCTPRTPMTAEAIDAAYAAGLAKWRQKDGHVDPNGVKSNVACMQCHAADTLDIAYYGFTDGDILRRGAQHLPVAEVAPIVDMVHALRDKYKIGRRDPLIARPFQPGGAVLQGNSIAERDAAFGQQLRDMNLRIATSPITSVADANLAFAQIANLDLHELRIPIPFNHYSEDINHNIDSTPIDCGGDIDGCRDHGSIADWMPSSPHIADDANKEIAVQDAYLANPNDATWNAYRSAIPPADNSPGFTGTPAARAMEHSKNLAQTLANYCLQLEVRGLPGCYGKGAVPFPNRGDIWDVGTATNLFGTGYSAYADCDLGKASCDAAPANLQNWPAHLRDDLSPGAKWSSNFSRLRHTWMMMWWVHFDNSLLHAGNDGAMQKDEYSTRSLYWVDDANNAWKFSNTPMEQTKPAYANFSVWKKAVINVTVLNNPNYSSCGGNGRLSTYPYNASDLGCAPFDIRNGFFPSLVFFSEGNVVTGESGNNIDYDIRYQPTVAKDREIYQTFAGNLYRLFLWKLIGAMQQDNWLCNPPLLRLRIKHAKKFLDQAETQQSAAAADAAMFAQLESLLSTAKSCTGVTPSVIQ